MNRLAVSDFTLTTALGTGRAITLAALRDGRSGLSRERFETAALDTWLGQVEGVDAVRMPAGLERFDCRNNRLAWLGLQADGFAELVLQARERHGAARVGVFLGTSTAGILQTELAYRRRDPASGALPADFRYAETHNTFSCADFVRHALGLAGPAFVVSTACSSGAKVFANARRLIDAGVIDAAVVGGIDSLCLTTLYGFNALELLSPEICRPWDAARRGLSIGEAAAYALVEREPIDRPAAWLCGVGESSDGHHMSSPHPEGAGAVLAMRAALVDARLVAADIGYLNLHGTATPGNDAVEDIAVCEVFGTALACSSTKGATGHTLGAAGAVEAAIAMLCLQAGLMPAGLHRDAPDATLRANYLDVRRDAELRFVASNSFGFGGSNACLVFGAAR